MYNGTVPTPPAPQVPVPGAVPRPRRGAPRGPRARRGAGRHAADRLQDDQRLPADGAPAEPARGDAR